MATSQSVAIADRKPSAIPPPLFNACFALLVINICYFPVAYVSGMWIWENSGLGIPTDFVNVWAAGKLVLDGHPALAYDWDIQKQVELALLGQDFPGYFAWHYPPPFLFVASLLAHVSLCRGFHRLDGGKHRSLSPGHARHHRPAVRLDVRARRFRWCSTTPWSGKTVFSPRH